VKVVIASNGNDTVYNGIAGFYGGRKWNTWENDGRGL